MHVVERGVHRNIGYLADVFDVGRGDDLGDVSRLQEVQRVLALEDCGYLKSSRDCRTHLFDT